MRPVVGSHRPNRRDRGEVLACLAAPNGTIHQRATLPWQSHGDARAYGRRKDDREEKEVHEQEIREQEIREHEVLKGAVEETGAQGQLASQPNGWTEAQREGSGQESWPPLSEPRRQHAGGEKEKGPVVDRH